MITTLALTFAVGFVAGVVNVVAGGGSLLTIWLLVETGMGAPVANATNRVGVLMQTVTSTRGFATRGMLPVRGAARLVPASLVGVAVGAVLAARLDEDVFNRVLAVLFACMGFVLIRRVLSKSGPIDAVTEVPSGLRAHAAMFFVGIYGGFVQAGVGVLILWVLHMVGRLEIVRANAVKSALVCVWTVLALAVFAFEGLVDWRAGVLLGVGGVVGAVVGVRIATRVSARALQIALAIGVWVAAARFAGLLG